MARKLNQRLRDLDKVSGAGKRSKGSTPPPSFGRDADPEPPVELAAFIMFALFGMLVLMGLAVLFGVRDVQDDVERRVTAALRSDAVGLTDFEVRVSGFDVLVVGTTDSEDTKARVEALGEQLDNIGEWEVNVLYEPAPESIDVEVVAEPFVVGWSSGRATATGTFSSQPVLDVVEAELEEVFPIVDLSALGITEGAPEEDWLSTIVTLIRRMAAVTPEGEVIVNPGANLVQVSAEFDTRQKQRDVRDEVEEILQAVTLQFSSGITAKDVPRVSEEEVIETQATLDEIIEGKVVEFAFGSAELTEEGRALLDEILDGLRENPLVGVEIAGHTDDVGDEEANLLLSQERAETVVQYFVSKGEDRARFVVVGFGESQPIADNATDEGRARNRRIEFTALLDEEEEE
jgi:OOP family OmpA-OmpF porin